MEKNDLSELLKNQRTYFMKMEGTSPTQIWISSKRRNSRLLKKKQQVMYLISMLICVFACLIIPAILLQAIEVDNLSTYFPKFELSALVWIGLLVFCSGLILLRKVNRNELSELIKN